MPALARPASGLLQPTVRALVSQSFLSTQATIRRTRLRQGFWKSSGRGQILAPDPATLSIFNSLLASIAEEMGATIGRSALSPNIRERRDYSCAVFDRRGQMIAQAAHIPVHLGAMPASVEAVQTLAPFAPGDLAILNDPYLGGTHLPDITMVSPAFVTRGGRNRLIGFVATRAHHADIGGMSPG